jgi:hypothetical protein
MTWSSKQGVAMLGSSKPGTTTHTKTNQNQQHTWGQS